MYSECRGQCFSFQVQTAKVKGLSHSSNHPPGEEERFHPPKTTFMVLKLLSFVPFI